MSQGDQFQIYFLKKAICEVKPSGLLLGFSIFQQPSTWHIIQKDCIKIQSMDPKICSIQIFYKWVWEQSLHHIISLSVCIYFLRNMGNMCITIVCFPVCDVINFEINLIFLIKLFFYMTKKLRQKFKCLENEGSFQDEMKSIFHSF